MGFIIWDESQRHTTFTNRVIQAKDVLQKTYGLSEQDIDELDAEFEIREYQDEAALLEAERKELAEIN